MPEAVQPALPPVHLRQRAIPSMSWKARPRRASGSASKGAGHVRRVCIGDQPSTNPIRWNAGSDPVLMLTGPIPATEKVLKKSAVPLDEIGVFEVNEAFAPAPLAWQAEIGAPPDRVNPLSGAIALGYPLGLPARSSRRG